MNTIKKASLLATAGLALSAAAGASDLDYSYAELRFVDSEIGNADGDGVSIGGSFDLGNNWLVVGNYTTLDFDGNVDANTLEIGAGYVYALDERWDLVSYAKVVRAELEANGFSADENGFALASGFRGMLTPVIEGRASINYVDIEESDSFVELGADYYFNEFISAGATINLGSEDDRFTLGVRWFFGQ